MTKPNSGIERIPFYVEMGRDVLPAWCHLAQRPTDHAVLICPPVGHEFINSYRGLRHLADGFARKGITTFRMEYQGVGDSSGLDTDPNRIQKWMESIEWVADFMREKCGIQKISLLGLRMGATLAAMVSDKIEIESLTCWVPVVEGRRYIREMLALQRTGENADLDVDSTSLEGGGFLLTRETMNEIMSLSMLGMNPNAKHIFLFSTDDLPAPTNLIEEWSSRGAAFQHAVLPGYADMMAMPHNNKVPSAAIDEITDQILQTKIPTRQIDCAPFLELEKYQQARYDCYTYGLSAKESKDAGGFPVTEMICQIPGTPLFGTLSLPLLRDAEHKPTVLLLNAGSVHRIGPNRNYVYIARQLLSLGFPVLRLDFLGLGDSIRTDGAKENDPYMPEALENIQQAIHFLKSHHHVKDVVLMGVCSGAYASFQSAIHLEEDAIHEIIPINPLTFYWREGMSLDVAPSNTYFDWNQYQQSMRRKDKWMKVLRGEKNLLELFETVMSVLKIKTGAFLKLFMNQIRRWMGDTNIEDLPYDLNHIANRKIKLKFIFADNDPGIQILMDNARAMVGTLLERKAIHIEIISKANHNFSTHLGRTQLLKKLNEHFSKNYE